MEKFLAGSFSVFQARGVEKVRLRMDSLAARIASERKWHPSQKIRKESGGGAVLTLRVGIAPDLINWVLSWGAHAEVLEPAHLRDQIANELRAATALYKTPPGAG